MRGTLRLGSSPILMPILSRSVAWLPLLCERPFRLCVHPPRDGVAFLAVLLLSLPAPTVAVTLACLPGSLGFGVEIRARRLLPPRSVVSCSSSR